MNKIIIIGCPGSGKTTFSIKLGNKLGIPVHHLDKYFWKENWTHLHQDKFRNIQNDLMKGDRWIIDGNFTKSIDNRIVKADTIIFFDIPKIIILWRILKRYFRDFGNVRHDMGGNNKSTLKFNQIKFVLNFPRKEIYMILEKYKDKKIIILHNPKEVSDFF